MLTEIIHNYCELNVPFFTLPGGIIHIGIITF